MNSHLNAAERRDRYWETLEGDETGSWDFGQWLAEVLEEHLGIIEDLMGSSRVAACFNDLLAEEKETIGQKIDNWREVFSNYDGSIWQNWRIGRELGDAAIYGRFGVTRSDIPLEERRPSLEALIERIEAFYERSNLDRIAGQENEVVKIVRLARARWNLDTEAGEIDPASLALLGGLSEGRIRNMMTGSDRVFENTGGKVSARSANQWLKSREAFYHSIWEQEEGAEPVDTDADMTDAVVVPRASDGSVFHPGLARKGRFTIGAKGRERQEDGFDEALRLLLNMSEPRWRRPNAAGNWGIVKGTELIRIEREDLVAGKFPY